MPRATRATKAELAKRVEAVLRLRLAGAEFWDIREFMSSEDPETDKVPWDVSDKQLRRYIAMTGPLLARAMEARREELLARHIAQRHHLYAKTMAQGDYRAALDVLKDEAKLQGLYTENVDVNLSIDSLIERELANLAAGGQGPVAPAPAPGGPAQGPGAVPGVDDPGPVASRAAALPLRCG
jgi:hypothetical protein